ncbi:putative type I restriction enzymeP M protein [Enhygromyxa salina]|uniref:site-specific DNA-methyltransferase (adenine-specific) n=1 Tax=Enhygromyxa salina TaxID=215803 RepID=A0A2S9XCT3_9BACT|nr:N-6 DNA methylase [Enhygromyxa salina]PRP90667.1 putative type I restriction enzymeP M protein [Enhygromyxa salina]
MTDVVSKLWGLCHTLRHDGVHEGDYLEQLTYLLFLKMVEEKGEVRMPSGCSWAALSEHQDASDLVDRYEAILTRLGETPGILQDIYAGARSRVAQPSSLARIIREIDEIAWTSLGTDVQGTAYESLLERATADGKKGAGQYFTPRALVQSIVRCVRPDPRDDPQFCVCDPACGTAGFLVAAYEWLAEFASGARSSKLWRRIRTQTYYGQELVTAPRRLGLMNLHVHGIEPTIWLGDAIGSDPPKRDFSVVLTNPPFGSRGSESFPDRPDFLVETNNKQINFLQHTISILAEGGRAAIVLPDSCLFEDKAAELFEQVTQTCDIHTLLRLPNGTFSPYAGGVRANVVFFTKGPATRRTWIYDARTSVPSVTKARPLAAESFAEFEACYGDDPDGGSRRDRRQSQAGRWRSFNLRAIRQAEFKFDHLRWLDDTAEIDEGGTPEAVALQLLTKLEFAVARVKELVAALGANEVDR